MHPVSADEIRGLAHDNGMLVEHCIADEDHLGRPDLRWTRMAARGRRVARDSAPRVVATILRPAYAARAGQFREASRTARRHWKQRSWCRFRLTRRFQL